MSENLKIIGAPGSHDTLVRVLGQAKPCRILDAPGVSKTDKSVA